MAQLKPCCGQAPNVMVLGSSVSIACVVCKASVSGSGYALTSELWNQSVDYRHGPADSVRFDKVVEGKKPGREMHQVVTPKTFNAFRPMRAGDRWQVLLYNIYKGFADPDGPMVTLDVVSTQGLPEASEPWEDTGPVGKPAPADSVRNDDAERARIASDKVRTYSVTPGFGIRPDVYEVDGKPATREQYLLAMLDTKSAEADKLRRRLDTANKLVELHTMSGDQLAEAQRDNARLKALCDEGARKIAELRQERNAATSARDYWHGAHDKLLANVQGALSAAELELVARLLRAGAESVLAVRDAIHVTTPGGVDWRLNECQWLLVQMPLDGRRPDGAIYRAEKQTQI